MPPEPQGIQFRDEQFASRSVPAQQSFLTGLVFKMGLAKDEKSASTVLLIAAILIGALAIGAYFFMRPAPVVIVPVDLSKDSSL